jgi:hypothetical protein
MFLQLSIHKLKKLFINFLPDKSGPKPTEGRVFWGRFIKRQPTALKKEINRLIYLQFHHPSDHTQFVTDPF